MGREREGQGGVHDDGVHIDHGADGVQVAIRCAHWNCEDGVGKAGIKHSARQPLNPGGGRPAPHADRHHARGQQQHVAALHVLKMRQVEAFGTGKPRVMLIDHLDQLGLPGPPRCGQAGDGGPVADPEA